MMVPKSLQKGFQFLFCFVFILKCPSASYNLFLPLSLYKQAALSFVLFLLALLITWV